jgi:hypothetical protein
MRTPCQEKRRHRTRKRADVSAMRLQRLSEWISPYHWPSCGEWHDGYRKGVETAEQHHEVATLGNESRQCYYFVWPCPPTASTS